jgi:hypothetical protein
MLFCTTGRRITHFKITALAASIVIVTGCATPLSREDRIGPDDGSDGCRQYVVALDSTGNFFAEDMLKGAVAGAVAGGLVAALTGGSSQDIAKGALIGGALGAIGGYYKSRMEQGRDQAVLAINNDLAREGDELDKADTAANALVACRLDQRDRIRADYASRRISRDEARRRWSQLQQQVARDNTVMQMVAENIGKRQEEYQYANEQIAAEFDISRLPPAEQRQARKRIQVNNQRIDSEYRREIAQIDKDVAKQRKAKKAKADLEAEKQRRQIAAQKARDTKKQVNEKTGGSPDAVKLASSYSSTRNKAENTVSTAKNYQATVAVTDEGFEKSTQWDNLQRPVYALHIVG